MRRFEWLRIPTLVCLLSLLALAPAAAATGPAQGLTGESVAQKTQDLHLEGDGPWVVRVLTLDREALRKLAQWADVWSVHKSKGYTLVQVNRADADRLVAEGFKVKLDRKRTDLLQRELARAVSSAPTGLAERNQTTGIPGYPCYRTVEETFATAEAIVAAHPTLATWADVGDSWEKTQSPTAGYDMKVLLLTNSAVPGPKPILFLNCAIHAREYTTAELCTRFAERLVAGYGVDADATWLLDDQEVHLLLHTNPDGRKRAETGLSWRKNTNNNYCSNTNYRGADLNRNFDFEWGCCGGSSGSACSETYRGPYAASEPEIQAVEAYVTSIFPDQRLDDLSTPAPDDATGVAIDIHSYGQLVIWPWGFISSPAPNGTELQTLGRKLAYFNGHEPEQAIGLYPTDGTSDSFYYGRLGVAAYGYELGTAFFESCTYFQFNILEQNIASLLYAAKVARTPYQTPAGPESLSVAVPPRAVALGDLVTVSATLNDTRYSTLNGTEPSQAIASAELCVDLPPWAAGAAPYAMSASDGLFDEAVEGVEATLDTTGLPVGRHTLYVRGVDAAGNAGSVSAVFLHVIDPATAPTLQGTVRDADSLAPLAATVRAGDFEATTDGNGLYSMRLPAGTYDVTVVATGYQSATAEDVVAVDSQTTIQDFDLPPFAGLWADDAEAGNPGWSAGSPWAITTEHAFSPTHAWSDSPNTLYANNANASLTSPVVDLQGYAGTTLSFRQRYELEQGYDFGHVEISTDGGSNWTEVAVYTGEQTSSWALAEIPLPALDGQAQARFRFRLESDDSVREDGWFLDDVLLRSVFGGNNVPAVTITAPPDGSAFEVGETVTFTGIASDVEDGDLSSALAWSSSIDGALGTGASLQISTLSEGHHTITAQVTDSGGASGSDEIAVRVGGCAVEVDFDDGGAAGWTNDPASTCTTGSFVVATPTQVSDSGVITQVGGDHTSGTGNAFFSAVNTAAGTDDVDGGVCIVESPVYTVTKASELSIWYFHGQRDAGGDPSGDYFVLELSTDGGSNWTPLASYGDETVNAAWTEATASVPAGSDVQIRVRVSDGPASGDLVEGGVDDVFICPVEAECTTDPECDDGLYCNGTETCNAGTCEAGTPVDCADGVACTVDSCNETTDSCESTPSDALCDDGLFCDGAETCDAVLGCQAGTPVDCTDGVDCTVDSCNETTDSCDQVPDDGFCADGVFCNGSEVCDPVLGCQAGGDPCPGLFCDETADTCVECFDAGDCDDGLYCNGAETCAGGTCQAGADPCPGQSCDEEGDTCIAAPTAQLEWGTVSVAGTAVTVPLAKVYTSPVVVTAVQYANNTVPVVTRIANVTPTSFDLRLQNPAGGTPVAESVSYLVVEEGVWTVDGMKIEAWTYTSTVTDENNSWLGEDQTYGQGYSDPVVLGQVMSTNDPDWSVFWDRGATRLLPPTATELGTGKHVAEDPDVTRADETVGVVVFEAGHGTLGGVEVEAALGPDSVRGVDNSPPYPYTFVTPFAAAPTVALVTQAGMQSSEGSWAQVHGATLATPTTLYLSVDEDQLGKGERRHSTERVGYVVFAAPGVVP